MTHDWMTLSLRLLTQTMHVTVVVVLSSASGRSVRKVSTEPALQLLPRGKTGPKLPTTKAQTDAEKSETAAIWRLGGFSLFHSGIRQNKMFPSHYGNEIQSWNRKEGGKENKIMQKFNNEKF